MSRSKGSHTMWALKSTSFPSHSVWTGLFGALWVPQSACRHSPWRLEVHCLGHG